MMASPAVAYATTAVGASSLAVTDAVPGLPSTEYVIAGVVITVSLFFIRRSDADARRERAEMRSALHRQNRMIAALLKSHTEAGIPLPAAYIDILNEETK